MLLWESNYPTIRPVCVGGVAFLNTTLVIAGGGGVQLI